MIDNCNSFAWNLYQYLCQLGEKVIVYRNDKISVEECLEIKPDRVVISPGPGTPDDTGISKEVIRKFAGQVPILGVCMGYECIYEVFGGKIIHCGEIVHGKASIITHDGKGIYEGIPNKIPVIRYHSLAGDRKTLSNELIITSETENGIIMGVRHKTLKIEGVQYHPESVGTYHMD